MARIACLAFLLISIPGASFAQEATEIFVKTEEQIRYAAQPGADAGTPTDAETELQLVPLRLSGELAFRPEDVENGSYVTPTVSGNYNLELFGKPEAGLNGRLQIAVRFQAPPTPGNPDELTSRIQLTGGIGSVDVSARARWRASNNRPFAVTAGISLSGAWQSATVITEDAPLQEADDAESFASSKLGLSLGLYLGPLYIGGQGAVFFSTGDGIVSEELNQSVATTILAIIRLSETYYLQAKYLPTADTPKRGIEVRLVGTFDPL